MLVIAIADNQEELSELLDLDKNLKKLTKGAGMKLPSALGFKIIFSEEIDAKSGIFKRQLNVANSSQFLLISMPIPSLSLSLSPSHTFS